MAWRRVVRGLIHAERWDPHLGPAVAMLAHGYHRWQEARAAARRPGRGDKLSRALEAEAWDHLDSLIYELGQDPAERARILGWLAGDVDHRRQGFDG